MRRKPTVILDRDGVLNRKPPPAQYVRNWSEWAWYPGSLEALRLLHDRDYRTIVASNQPGIGRGVMNDADLQAVHDRMKREIAQAGGGIDAIYYCPHDSGDRCAHSHAKPRLLSPPQRYFLLEP